MQINPYELLFPPQIVRHMTLGWNSHFGINQLTRAKLAALSVIEQEEYELKLVVGADKIKMTPPTLDAKDEENTSAIELLEAYPAFITLIHEHYKGGNNEHAQRLADEFQAHWDRMFAAPDFYSCFKTYLFYDIGLHKQFPFARGMLHPSVWQSDLWSFVVLQESTHCATIQDAKIKAMESQLVRAQLPLKGAPSGSFRASTSSSRGYTSQSAAFTNASSITSSPKSKCIYWAKTSHGSRSCPETETAVLICNRNGDKQWKIKATGLQICFGFNGPNGCRTPICSFEHICSLCGAKDHSCQSCPKE